MIPTYFINLSSRKGRFQINKELNNTDEGYSGNVKTLFKLVEEVGETPFFCKDFCLLQAQEVVWH